jgi:hypothetical protein
VFILREVKVFCFETLSEVLILKALGWRAEDIRGLKTLGASQRAVGLGAENPW